MPAQEHLLSRYVHSVLFPALLAPLFALGCKHDPAVVMARSPGRQPVQAQVGTRVRAQVKVRIVGCPSDGQQGSEPAPAQPRAAEVILPPALAGRLAYFQGAYGLGVLAPGSWHCLNLEGSNGDVLLVTPGDITGKQFFAKSFKGIDGPAVQLSERDAGTSGRFDVAEMINRVFPSHKAFADQVLAEGILKPSDLPTGKYPADRLTYRSPEWVEYTTPPHAEGLGTHTHLNASDEPIHGFAMLAGDPEEFDLVQLSVRVAPPDRDLASIVLQQAEKEARQAGTGSSRP